jgi:peptide-methionine (S)-S-oxide reductase
MKFRSHRTDRGTGPLSTESRGAFLGAGLAVAATIFDRAQISYGQLLQIAFSVAYDPALLNRQGPHSGTQYRSAVFYSDDNQKHIAEAYIAQLDKSHAFPRPIVTRVDPLKGFFPAEDYHEDYLIRNPTAPYIAINDMPKVENFRRTFPDPYSGKPVLVSARCGGTS